LPSGHSFQMPAWLHVPLARHASPHPVSGAVSSTLCCFHAFLSPSCDGFQLDGTLSSTCSEAGTVVPAPCPNGSLCGVPYLSPVLAPPGFAELTLSDVDAVDGVFGVEVDDPMPGRTLVPCPPGFYCPLGSSWNTVNITAELDCPPVCRVTPCRSRPARVLG
jgi:hypothetical protein